jgi:hypothetical protein
MIGIEISGCGLVDFGFSYNVNQSEISTEQREFGEAKSEIFTSK